MPAYIGIDPYSPLFFQWFRKEVAFCCFGAVTSCRITPVIQKDMKNTRIYQVLSDTPLTACLNKPYPDLAFVHKIGHYWAISTNSITKCHSANIPDSNQYKIMDNRAITLPPTALIVTKDSTALSCDLFYLPERLIQSKPKIGLYQNVIINIIEEELIDLYSFIHSNANWDKLPYIPSHIQTIIDFITDKTQPPGPPLLRTI